MEKNRRTLSNNRRSSVAFYRDGRISSLITFPIIISLDCEILISTRRFQPLFPCSKFRFCSSIPTHPNPIEWVLHHFPVEKVSILNRLKLVDSKRSINKKSESPTEFQLLRRLKRFSNIWNASTRRRRRRQRIQAGLEKWFQELSARKTFHNMSVDKHSDFCSVPKESFDVSFWWH